VTPCHTQMTHKNKLLTLDIKIAIFYHLFWKIECPCIILSLLTFDEQGLNDIRGEVSLR